MVHENNYRFEPKTTVMATKEKEALITLVSSILILFFYSLYVYNTSLDGHWERINDFHFWGKTFLILIPVTIVTQLVIHILFAIIRSAVSKEEDASFMDERDKLIDLKSIRVSHWIFAFGFFLAMTSQALSMEPWVMFITLIGSGFLSSSIAQIAKIYFYRKGV